MVPFRVDITDDLARLTINLNQPPGGEVRQIPRLRAKPDRVFVELQAERLAILRPLAKILPLHVETLNAPILAVSDIDDVVLVDLNRMRQAKLSGSGAGRAEFS